jgi:MoaA/NifB/PqqE/SkfB family radical SAM enzyme
MSGAAPVRSVTRNADQKCVYRSIDSDGIRVLWEVTSACNLKCDFCLVAIKRRPLPLERTLAIARDLVACGAHKFLISGGEPLLYPGIETLIEDLVERGVLVKLLTNGTVPNERVFALIRRTPTMEVSLSIQTVEEPAADRIFGRAGAFRRVEQTIDELPRERLNVICAVSTMNEHALEDVIDWVAEKGIPCVSLTNIFKDPSSRSRFREDCRDYAIAADRWTALFELVERKRAQYDGRLVIRTTQFRGGDGERCGAGRSVLYLDSTGCLLPCTLTENEALRERVRTMTIPEVVRFYRETLPAVPPSSCVPLFRIAERPVAVGE